MSAVWTALSIVAGLSMITVACRDIFDLLFHPEGRATVGRLVCRSVWLAMRRLGPQRPQGPALAGPPGLLSASISWLLLVYPVLARRRSLAYEVSLLRREEAETGTGLETLDQEVAERVYAELTSRLIAVERDFVSFPITYYFVEPDPRFSLAATAPYLVELAERGDARKCQIAFA
jgi:hypothetical protein